MVLYTTPEEYFRLKLKNCPAQQTQKIASLAGEMPVAVAQVETAVEKIKWIIISAALGTAVAFLIQYLLTRRKT